LWVPALAAPAFSAPNIHPAKYSELLRHSGLINAQRLRTDGDGLVVPELTRPFSDGSTHQLFKSKDFIARLAALAPRRLLPIAQPSLDACALSPKEAAGLIYSLLIARM